MKIKFINMSHLEDSASNIVWMIRKDGMRRYMVHIKQG